MSCDTSPKNILELIQEIIDNSPVDLTQTRIDYAFQIYFNIVDEIIKKSPTDLTQFRIDNIDMKMSILYKQ